MKQKKLKILIIILFVIMLLICGLYYAITKQIRETKEEVETSVILENLKELPLPEVAGGERGKLGIDKNINELNIDEYLGRSDAVYRDMRMLKDPGNYEAIGGDSYLSGYIDGFEVVPFPYIVTVSNLPEEVGDTYLGDTLFSKDEEGKYTANYDESMQIIEELFPKDKVIFLMCGGGGYAGMMKDFLVSSGWDANKIYNIGGYWYYDGKNNIEVKKMINGKIEYDFENVPYHEIKFDTLSKINHKIQNTKNKNSNTVNEKTAVTENKINKEPIQNSNKVTLDSAYYGKQRDEVFDVELDLVAINDEALMFDVGTSEGLAQRDKFLNEALQKKADIINNLIDKKASFIVLVNNLEDLCEAGSDEYMDAKFETKAGEQLRKSDVYYYNINLPIFRKTKLFKTVRYAPTIIIIEKGEVAAYVDANKDLLETREQIQEWLESHLVIK